MVIVKIWEGLGNQLFQYAYARSLALRTGKKVYIDTENGDKHRRGTRTRRKYQLQHFQIRQGMECNFISKIISKVCNKEEIAGLLRHMGVNRKSFVYLYEEDTLEFKPELLDIKGVIYIEGWFQNEAYFAEYREIIKREFRPRAKIKIVSELRTILKERETVSIHIRRGDYKKYGYMLPKSYYEHAIAYIEKQIDEPFFLIFSDEPKWAGKNLNLENSLIVGEVQELQDYEELFLMSKCRHNIISNSTFSWWGAWLNSYEGKIVIGPQQWFAPNSRSAGINIMPEAWIRVKC